tara:strand:- start:7099 stop:7848 length:750 start_codon:yes stop_codon:yes gene_type:complete
LRVRLAGLLPLLIEATGVGHFFTAVANPSPLLLLTPLRLWFPHTVGVGHNPDSLSPVRGAQVICSQHSPLRIEPQLGQVSENSSEPARSESWAVFHEDEAGSYFANDPSHLAPQAGSLAIEAGASASNGYVLTRESARNHVNKASPRSAGKCANVIPYREGRENAVILSGGKNACGVGVELDSADRAPSEEVAAENSATSACEKSQLIQDNPLSASGIITLPARWSCQPAANQLSPQDLMPISASGSPS